MSSPAQIYIGTLANAIQGGCGYPCESGDLSGLIWTTAAQNLYAVATTLGMVGRQQLIDGLNSFRIAGTRHLNTLVAAGDSTAAAALLAFTQVIATLLNQAAAVPINPTSPLDLYTASGVMAGKQTPVGNQQALRAARVITGRYLAIPPGGLGAEIAAWKGRISSTPPPPVSGNGG